MLKMAKPLTSNLVNDCILIGNFLYLLKFHSIIHRITMVVVSVIFNSNQYVETLVGIAIINTEQEESKC